MNTYSFIDTHTHPQMSHYDADRDKILTEARNNNIGMICVGIDLKSSHAAIELSHKYKGMWATVGLHPNDSIHEIYSNEPYRVLAMDQNVVAIGEIGLDYYRTSDKKAQQIQRDRFLQQIQLAIDLKKPVIIHCRDAHEAMLEILSGYRRENLQGVIHSFTGTWSEAEEYLKLGYFIGFNGIITFARQYDETVINMPLERMLIETDAPFLTPEPFRGKRNESSYIVHIAQKIALLRNVEITEISMTTTNNAVSLFSL